MQVLPYSIYIDKRPLRIAFFVNPNRSNPRQLDAILGYNQDKWGGRFNPIIFTDGKTIEEKWWKFLRDVDPDVIKSLVPLQDNLLEKIETFLSPYSVEVPRRVDENDTDYSVHISDECLSILPTPDNVAKVSRSFIGNSKLVFFELGQTKDEIVKQFIHRNFGTYTRTIHIDRAFHKNEKKVFSITNRESLAAAFMELSTFERFTYPIQICSLPNTFKDVKYNRTGEIFTVVIGDALEDIVFSWNRTLSIPQWKRIDINQIWLPTEIANDTQIENALKGWLQRAADPSGATNQEIQFVSFSLKKPELEQIANRLTKDIWLRKTVRAFTEMQIPSFQPRVFYLRLKENTDLYRATGNEEKIVLNEPDVLEGVMGGEYWMADVYIQFRPERYANFVKKNFWWQLPQRNHLAHDIFHKPSRIGSDGFPSVSMKRGEPTLSVKLLDDESVFRALIIGENTPYYTADPRRKFVYRPFDDVRRSDKGRYLSGFLDLFSGLSFAYRILENRYWRHMFNILSHQSPTKDEKKLESILRKLEKKLQSSGDDFLGKPEGLEWLGKYVLQLSKEQAATGKELLFKAFVKEAKKELEEFNSSRQEDQKSKLNEQDVKDALAGLTELSILLIGVRPRCPLCGYTNWYHIDKAQQILQCKGCGHKYPVRPQEEWYYNLNSLVQIGCAQHGLVPVVLVLGQLLHQCRSSFFMSTSLEVFKTGKDNPFSDLDIVCIKDGKFIIGEIKQSIGLFKKSDFEKMAEIAEILKPDTLIFSSLDPKLNVFVNNNLASLRKRLAPLGIEVRWYQLHSYIFEASPVR